MGLIQRPGPPYVRTTFGFLGFFGLLGLVVTFVLASVGSQQRGLTSAYASAPVCVSTADISSGRFQGSARIVRTFTCKNTQLVDVGFALLGGRVVSAYCDRNYPVDWQRWKAEDVVDAELWRGRLKTVGGGRTTSTPDSYAGSDYTKAAWISGPISIVLSVLLVLWFVLYRRDTQERAARLSIEAAEHPASADQLPLTADMTSFLKQEAALGQHPYQIVMAILGAAAIIPALFSIVFLIENRFFMWFTPIMWTTFLGLAGLLAWWILHGVGQERRDLAGGVFLRSTGAFSVKVTATKYGTTVNVVIDGRELSGSAPSLESIESGVGTVDYLPISADLMEVRDESGQVLWSRFASAQSAAR